MDISTKMALNFTEAAELLGVSRPTMYQIAHSEGFPTVRVGRRVLIPRAGLERWLEAQAEVHEGV